MKVSARNQRKGKIVAVKEGATTSHVSIDIGQGTIIMASITNEAVADLALKVGYDAWAIIRILRSWSPNNPVAAPRVRRGARFPEWQRTG